MMTIVSVSSFWCLGGAICLLWLISTPVGAAEEVVAAGSMDEATKSNLRHSRVLQYDDFPMVATAIALPGSDESVAALDLIGVEFEIQGNKVTYIVQSQVELDAISALPGLIEVGINQAANKAFWENNKRFGGGPAPVKNPIFFDDGGGGRKTRRNLLRINEDRHLQTYDTIAGYSCYRTIQSSFTLMDDLATQYPNLTTVLDIGDSYLKTVNPVDGFDMKVLKITADNPNISTKGKMFAMFGIHAREFAPPELGMRFAELLLDGYDVDPQITSILDHNEIHLLLQANPDGRAVDEVDQNLRRKNMNPTNGANCGSPESVGVDLNRNFPFMWGRLDGSSNNPCAATYHGSHPGSEPEIQAIVNYVNGLYPASQVKAEPEGANLNDPYDIESATGYFIDVHAYGELNIYPWGWINSLSPNDEQLLTLARKLKYFNGHALSGPEQPDFLYVVSGASSDWAYGQRGVSGFSYELGTAFYQSCSYFEQSIVPTNLQSMLYSASVAKFPYKTPLGPDVTSIGSPFSTTDSTVIPSVPQDSTLVVSVTVSDDEYSTFFTGRGKNTVANGISTGQQNIQSVTLYIDVHPDDDLANPPPTGIAMSGTFGGSTTETATVDITLDAGSYSIGSRHTLYVVATDSEGYTGPVTSRYFDICDPADTVNCASGPPPPTCLLAGEGLPCSSSTDCCSGVGNCSGGKPSSKVCL